MAVYMLVERYTGKKLVSYWETDQRRFEVGGLHTVKRKTYRVEALIISGRNGADFEVVVERVK